MKKIDIIKQKSSGKIKKECVFKKNLTHGKLVEMLSSYLNHII